MVTAGRATCTYARDFPFPFRRLGGSGPANVGPATRPHRPRSPHFFLARDGPDWNALEALPVSELANVQLSDGVPFGDRAYFEATMNERLLPGQGEFDLARFARELKRMGFDGAVIVEVLNAQLRKAPIETFAQQAAETSRRWWGGA